MTFRIGQKVVCVKEPIIPPVCPYQIFKKGDVYTVAFFDEFEGEKYIGVYELSPKVHGLITGFRPVCERKTDISAFTEILNLSSVRALSDVEAAA